MAQGMQIKEELSSCRRSSKAIFGTVRQIIQPNSQPEAPLFVDKGHVASFETSSELLRFGEWGS